MSAMSAPSSGPAAAAAPAADAEDASRSPRHCQLIWWRFRKHKLAVVSGVIVVAFYLVALFADFLAYADPTTPTRSAR